MKKLDKKGFTLIELIVVIAVVGILVLLAMPRFIGYRDKAELSRIQHDVKVMEQKIGTVLINNDDDFNNWENNSKDFNQLIQENKLFEKEGPVEEELSIDETYKVIPEKYKDNINTKLKGTFYANSDGKVYYEHEKPLLGIPTEPEEKEQEYSDEEIEDLINNDFIPIATAEELNSIRNNEERTYGKGTKWEGLYTGGLDKKYVQVLNVDLSEYSGEGWTPIGSSSSSFTGTYDGGNYVITGLEVKGEGQDYQGLFGSTAGATISNVALEDINVTGNSSVGGLVGWARDSTEISNSYSTGTVTGADRQVGGLVGWIAFGTNINNSYATGSVKGSNDVGGLVGFALNNTNISNSYATGSITGNRSVGGLVGFAVNSAIENSYATGLVEGSGYNVGGLVGYVESNTKISNSYATGSVTGEYNVGGLVGGAPGSTTISNSYATGKVTGVNWVGGLVGWAWNTDISNSYSTGSVKGTEQVGGLVGFADNNTIKNSYATGLVEGSGYSVGGLVGQTDNGTEITHSYATGSVEGLGSLGGLVGVTQSNTTISNSYATGSVTGGNEVGGLVGVAVGTSRVSISNSYATGPVEGTGDNVGGLVGVANSSSEISNSYWNTETTGQLSSALGLGIGKSTGEMKMKAAYSGWNFDTVWKIDEGVSYPTLR